MPTAVKQRERNGREQRRLTRQDDLLVALTARQPHRRGERTTIAATPWQRALKAGTVFDPARNGYTAGELELAGLSFAEARLCYLKAVAAPNGFAVDSHGSGGDLPPFLRRRWLNEWSDILAVLRRHGDMALKSVFRAVEAHPEDEERLWPEEYTFALSRALMALAGHFKVRLR